MSGYLDEMDSLYYRIGDDAEAAVKVIADRYIGSNPPLPFVLRAFAATGIVQREDGLYEMDFAARFPRAAPDARVYAAGLVWSDNERSLDLLVCCYSPVRLCLNGELIYRSNAVDEVQQDRYVRVSVVLRTGWNTLLLQTRRTTAGFGCRIGADEAKVRILNVLAPFAERKGQAGWVYSEPTVQDALDAGDPALLQQQEAGSGLRWFPELGWTEAQQQLPVMERLFGRRPAMKGYAWSKLRSLLPGAGQTVVLQGRSAAPVRIWAGDVELAVRTTPAEDGQGLIQYSAELTVAGREQPIMVEVGCGETGWSWTIEARPIQGTGIAESVVEWALPLPVHGAPGAWLYLGPFDPGFIADPVQLQQAARVHYDRTDPAAASPLGGTIDTVDTTDRIDAAEHIDRPDRPDGAEHTEQADHTSRGDHASRAEQAGHTPRADRADDSVEAGASYARGAGRYWQVDRPGTWVRPYYENAMLSNKWTTSGATNFGRWDYPLGVTMYGLLKAGRMLGEDGWIHYARQHIESCTSYDEYAFWDREQYGFPSINQQLVLVKMLDNCGSFGSAMLESLLLEQRREAQLGTDTAEHEGERAERAGSGSMLVDLMHGERCRGQASAEDGTPPPTAASKQIDAVRIANRIAHFIRYGLERREDGAFYRICAGEYSERSMWADDLYMSTPFMLRYYKLTGDRAMLDDAMRQFILYRNYLYMPDHRLMSHVYDFKYGTPTRIPWGRGNGWTVFSLSEVLELAPPEHPLRGELLTMFNELCAGYAEVQADSGLWRQVLHEPAAYEEASCTAMFVYAFARGVCHGWLQEPGRFAAAALRGWQGLLRHAISREGNVYGVCSGSRYSFTADYYTEELRTVTNDNHGIGIMLLAGAEVSRLQQHQMKPCRLQLSSEG